MVLIYIVSEISIESWWKGKRNSSNGTMYRSVLDILGWKKKGSFNKESIIWDSLHTFLLLGITVFVCFLCRLYKIRLEFTEFTFLE